MKRITILIIILHLTISGNKLYSFVNIDIFDSIKFNEKIIYKNNKTLNNNLLVYYSDSLGALVNDSNCFICVKFNSHSFILKNKTNSIDFIQLKYIKLKFNFLGLHLYFNMKKYLQIDFIINNSYALTSLLKRNEKFKIIEI